MAKSIVITFPGIGYHCDKPLLYYARRIAKEHGYEEFINVDYSYNGGNLRGDEEKMQQAFESLYKQAVQKLSDVVWGDYDRILFISKSIGTVIASEYAYANGLVGAAHILYTPLKNTFETMIFGESRESAGFKMSENAVAFIGTADPWSNVPKLIDAVNDKDIPLYVYDGANHSLETDDTIRNVDILYDVVLKTVEFIEERSQDGQQAADCRYFVTNAERTSTAYHEFYMGKWDGQTFWRDDSIFLSDDLLEDNRAFFRAIKSVVPYFDPYGVTEISINAWDRIGEIIANTDSDMNSQTDTEDVCHMAEMYAEADKWVKQNCTDEECFTILGL